MDFNSQKVEQVIERACAAIDGDLILVGGALVSVWLEPRRLTEDIDIFHRTDRAAAQIALWDIAADLGLPIEAINGAAEYFIRRIPNWDHGLVVLSQGDRGRVLRPSFTVFLLSKISRLSERDLTDCRAALAADLGQGADREELDIPRVRAALLELPEPEIDARLRLRRATLASLLVER